MARVSDCDHDPTTVIWGQVSDVAPGVIGGLVLAYAERARAESYDNNFDRDNMTFWAVAEALEAVRRGVRPDRPVGQLPAWIAALLRRRIANRGAYWLDASFLVVRVLELAGLIELDVDDTYVLAMLIGLTAERSERYRTKGDPIDWFRQDPQLIERAYWRALAIEGDGVISIRIGTWQDRSPWRAATLTMIAEGLVPRDRVIDACLSALAQDFASAAARWYLGTLLALDLTVAELAERQSRLVRLLAQRSQVITPAVLTWLRELSEADRLDDLATAPALAVVPTGGPKATALNALRLLSVIHRRTASADVITAARAGLAHSHSDVQRAAAKLLITAGGRGVLLADAELVDPAVRREFDLPIELEDSPSRAVDDRTSAASSPRRQRPAATDDDVVERLAALLEDPSDPDAIELVLDRLAQSSAGSLLAPLTRRARAVLRSTPGNWDGEDRLQVHLADLVLAAVEPGGRAGRLGPPVPRASGSRFLHHRVAEVRSKLLGETAPGPLLALPTDPAGWIDPEVFVRRLEHSPEPGRYDLIAALLRLTEVGRSTALGRWLAGDVRLAPELDHPVRYALGEEPAPGVELRDRAVWVAASRGRHPLEEDPLLIAHGLGGSGQGRPLRAAVTFGSHTGEFTYGMVFDHPASPPSTSHSRRDSWWTTHKRPVSDQPTAKVAVDRYFGRSRESWPTWLATLWPAEAEHFAATAVDAAFDLIAWQSKDRLPYGVVSALTHHQGRMGSLSHATFALGLNAVAVDARVLAVDHVIELVGRGRVSVTELATALASSLPLVVLSRWADSLRRLADAGRPDLTIELLTSVLPQVPSNTRGVHALLDVLHQELLRTGRTPQGEPLWSYLSAFGGSSKAARSARAILTLT